MILTKVKIIVVSLMGILLFNNVRLQTKVNTLDKQVEIAMNNAKAWEQIANKTIDDNTVLELTLNDFKKSNDSLVNVNNLQRKQLRIKDEQLRQVIAVETVIRDTITSVIKDADFLVELKPNQLTTITVSRKDSILTHTMEILNHQDLYVYETKHYRRDYKNWFQRLMHFDFKKNKTIKYQIINSNDLIKTTGTRVINISK